MMPLPSRSDPLWNDLLLGQTSPRFSSLATRLAVGRLRQAVRQNPATLTAALDEVYRYFQANDSARRDLPRP
jgi:hypothetical protein